MNAPSPIQAFLLGILVTYTSPAFCCAVEHLTMDGPTFPPSGSGDLPLNLRFVIFPDNDPAPTGSFDVRLLDDNGNDIGQAPTEYQPSGRVYEVKPEGLEVDQTYSLQFSQHADWTPPIPQQAPEGGIWREPIAFSTGNALDEDGPGGGSVAVRLGVNTMACLTDYETCGPWYLNNAPSPVHLRIVPGEFDGTPGPVGYRVWVDGRPVSYSTIFAPGGPLWPESMMVEVVAGHTCCADGHSVALYCESDLEAPTFELEAFDAAGNTWWSGPVTTAMEDLEGYDELLIAPAPPEPEPAPTDFEPPEDIEDGCSSTPIASLFPVWLGLLAWRRRL